MYETELLRTVTVNCKFSLGPRLAGGDTTTDTGAELDGVAVVIQPESVRAPRSRVTTSRSLYVLLRELF
jgi:hypothetical protein